MAAVLEHAEFAAEPEIHRAASKLFLPERRRDLDLSLFDVAADIDVRQNHFSMIEDARSEPRRKIESFTR
jgi:hypothetical protein